MTPSRVAILAGEEDLGIQQQCRRCRDWWPYHPDFFYIAHHCNRLSGMCRACYREVQTEQQRVRRMRQRVAA